MHFSNLCSRALIGLNWMLYKKKEIILSIHNILPEKGNTSSACCMHHPSLSRYRRYWGTSNPDKITVGRFYMVKFCQIFYTCNQLTFVLWFFPLLLSFWGEKTHMRTRTINLFLGRLAGLFQCDSSSFLFFFDFFPSTFLLRWKDTCEHVRSTSS